MVYDAMKAWSEANKGNPTVSAASNDLFYNSLLANASTGAAVSYANQMIPLALRFQQGVQGMADESNLRTMAAEGSLLRGLTQQQGDLEYRNRQLDSQTNRYAADRALQGTKVQSAAMRYDSRNTLRSTKTQAAAQRYGYKQELKGVGLQTGAQRYESDRQTDRTRLQTEADRYSYDRALEGTKYGADRDLEGRRYVSDNELTGARERNQSEERRIGLAGEEERKSLRQGTDETLRLRADARGAIRSAGSRFYG
jgi:hypothetical protein